MLTPLIIITITFVIGILTGNVFHVSMIISGAAMITCIICAFMMFQTGQKADYLVIFLIFLFGIFSIQSHDAIPANDISHFADGKYVRIIGAVADEPALSDGLTRTILRVHSIIVRGVTCKISGNISLFIEKSKDQIYYGDQISVAGKLSSIISTSNPGISSYTDIMAKRNIRCQMLSPGSGVKILARSIGNPFIMLSIIIRDRLISVIHSSSQEPYSSMIGSIIFGSRASPLPNELKDTYRSAGVIHLFIVSGLQVSIIASLVLTLCKSAGLSRIAKLTTATSINILFAIIVGAGPSVVRAVIMSEAALVANVFERETDFYSSLSLAALILLIFRSAEHF